MVMRTSFFFGGGGGWADSCKRDTEQQLSFRYQDGGGFTQVRLCGEHWNGVNGTDLVEIDWPT